MTQGSLGFIPCALTTHGEFNTDGSKRYRAVCACGWVSEWKASGPDAAGEWIEHRGDDE